MTRNAAIRDHRIQTRRIRQLTESPTDRARQPLDETGGTVVTGVDGDGNLVRFGLLDITPLDVDGGFIVA